MREEPQEAAKLSADYLETVRSMATLLIQQGYRPGVELLYVDDRGAAHHEEAWAQRLPNALRFLLAGKS